ARRPGDRCGRAPARKHPAPEPRSGTRRIDAVPEGGRRPMQPRVVSVQIGGVRVLGSSGAVDPMDRPWASGIFKAAVSGRRVAGPLGFDGDEQADLEHHGGPDKALLAYSAENLATWTDLLGDV